MTGLYPDQTKSKELRLYLRQTVPDVVSIGQRFIEEKYNSIRVGKIYHYHNPRDIGTSGHDDMYSWDQTINPYGRDKKEEYKINGYLSYLELLHDRAIKFQNPLFLKVFLLCLLLNLQKY